MQNWLLHFRYLCAS